MPTDCVVQSQLLCFYAVLISHYLKILSFKNLTYLIVIREGLLPFSWLFIILSLNN